MMTCPVCLEPSSFTLACGHSICPHHLLQWVRRSTTCPVCRSPIECKWFAAGFGNPIYSMTVNQKVVGDIVNGEWKINPRRLTVWERVHSRLCRREYVDTAP